MNAQTIATLYHDGHTLWPSTLKQQVYIILIGYRAMHCSHTMHRIETDRIVQLHLSLYHRVHIHLLWFAGNGGVDPYRYGKAISRIIGPLLRKQVNGAHCHHQNRNTLFHFSIHFGCKSTKKT